MHVNGLIGCDYDRQCKKRNFYSVLGYVLLVIIHQRRGYLGEWANADKIDLLVLSDGVDEHLTSDTLP
jgi:hypothetical protein